MDTPPDLEEATLKQAEHLINRRNFNGALALLHSHVVLSDHDKALIGAKFWLTYINAQLMGNGVAFEESIRSFRAAPGYSSLLEGDLMRDQSFAALRDGKLAKAMKLWQELMDLGYHEKDRNRLAMLELLHGRILFTQREYDAAEESFRQAFDLLPSTGRNPQWQYNIQFHWLRAAIMTGQKAAIEGWYPDYLREEPSRGRRIAAWLMYHLGRFGVQIVNLSGR